MNSHIFSLQSRQTDGSEFPVQGYFLGQRDQGQIVLFGVLVPLITSHEERERELTDLHWNLRECLSPFVYLDLLGWHGLARFGADRAAGETDVGQIGQHLGPKD